MMLRLLTVFAMAAALAQAQQPIGTVGVADATVAGPLVVNNGLAVLEGGATVTAKDQTATVKLNRGGEVRVCATSSLHLTAGKSASGPEPLLLTLGRGAMEVQMPVTESDAIMTPDLRFAMKARGPLDLRLRVTDNGDTCVENRGSDSPALRITDPFGGAMYILLGGQHVLFEHASLKEVVDNETSPCGCPPPPVVSVADAGTTSATPAAPGSIVDGKAAAEQHPFPAAVSDGLAKPTVPQAAPGIVHVQVATAMHYDAGAATGAPQGSGAAAPAPTATAESSGAKPSVLTPPSEEPPSKAATTTEVAQAPPSPSASTPKDVVHSIGHFFKRLFRRL